MPILKQAVSSARGNVTAFAQSRNFIGAPSFATNNPAYSFFDHYTSYASAYPNIRAIANEYMQVMPYAIDGNGEPQEDNEITNALYHPNQDDSSVSFFEKTAVSTLAHRKTYLLVWRREGLEAKPGGNFRTDSIAGFTFLEYPAIERRDGRTYYRIGVQEFSDKEVLVLPGGVDPTNLYQGYSPSEASRKWATLDDYIADFQSGFFENNAIPAGTFVITAKTKPEYDDIVDTLQKRHRGAGSNNNVSYASRPVDQTTGKVSEHAQIEWIPFAQSNKEIDFKNLFEQVNKRIDMAYGVSQFIKGVDDAPNYATAQVSDKNFSKRAVKPLLLRNYTQINHELNRITGGTGIAITFKYEIPAVSDEEKVKVETKNIEGNIIKTMVAEGYSLNSVVDAFQLSNSYKQLSKSNEPTKIENDKPDVDEGDEVTGAPDPAKIDGVTPVNKLTEGGIVEKNVLFNTEDAPCHVIETGGSESKNPKSQLSSSDVEMYEQRLSFVIRDHMEKQIQKYIDSLDTQSAEGDPGETDTEEFTNDMMVVIAATMLAAGMIQYTEGMAMLIAADISIDNLTSYVVSESQEKAYRDYLINVANSYGDDTGAAIRSVLNRGNVEGWDKARLESELRNIMNTDEWRVKRLSTSEINLSQSKGSLHAMQQIQDEADVNINKVWTHSGGDGPCEFCLAMIDTKIPIDDDFVKDGDVVTGEDGGLFVNSWRNIDSGGLHANCHCLQTFEVAS